LSGGPGLAELLAGLAARLPDEALATCFPDRPPAMLRTALQDAARRIARFDQPTGADRCPPPEPAPFGASLALYTDGAARGNPGAAGAGILLLDDRRREVAAKGLYLGECTNNVAEYRALILGLQEARRQGAGELAVHLDSELIVKQLLGSYRVRDPKLKPLHAEAAALLEGFRSCRIVHVPRQENRRADQLANQGIDDRPADDH
jgi:ribonuclease HI